jgi:acyl homoserine lactone synthase
MRVTTRQGCHLPRQLFGKLASYRHKVFVERLGWQLQAEDGLEFDQFDRPDTVYVIARDDEGHVIGCARLLPTTRPYLLGEVFPELMHDLPVPSSPEIWELSRFAAVDVNGAATMSPLGQFSSPIAVNLLQASIDSAAERGARQLITVSPLGIERLLRKAWFSAHRAGPPLMIGGHPVFACLISI